MGACTFSTVAHGVDANDAFKSAVECARYEHGHGGYTGTIAEKQRFVMIDLPEGQSAGSFIEELLDDDDSRICDKWGPAGCIDLGNNKYVFFGWASE